MATDDDKKVKQVLDAATQADLERWFSLPSFQQLQEEPSPRVPDDNDLRVAAITAAVDPSLLAAIHARTDENPRELSRFAPVIDVHIDPDFAQQDPVLLARASSLAEPRDIDLGYDFEDELKECAPQALLRDLHRPELEFEMQFEVVDMAAEQRFDIVAEVASLMATCFKLPPLAPAFAEGFGVLADIRAARERPWTEYLSALRNGRLSE